MTEGEYPVYLSENILFEILQGILDGFVTVCQSHVKKLVNLEIIHRTCNPPVSDTKKYLEKEENRKMRQLELP